jgi:hypothetical protein
MLKMDNTENNDKKEWLSPSLIILDFKKTKSGVETHHGEDSEYASGNQS